MRLRAASLALLAGAIAVAGCGSDPPPDQNHTCVENLNTDCSELLYDPPVYSTIYSKILQPKCATGSGCHSADVAMGGLAVTDADQTYDALLGIKGGVKRVIPRDAACSPLMVRLESRDPNFVMPRGDRLTEPALCVFVQWIKQGALKN